MLIFTGVEELGMVAAAPAFGPALRTMRLAARLTQHQLAERSGVSTAAIRDLEQGRSSQPRQRSLRALATALAPGREWTATRSAPDGAGAGPAPVDGTERACPASTRQTGPRTGPNEPLTGLHTGPLATRVEILGPLTVRLGGAAVPTGFRRHLVILGRLALTPNLVVHRDEMIDLLWGDQAPDSAVTLVQRYVARLRQLLDPTRVPRQPCTTIERLPEGYRLNVTAEQLDLLQHQTLVRAARDADGPRRALELLDQALALWQDDPLADMPELWHHPAVTALTEERVDLSLWHSRLAEQVAGPHAVVWRIHQLALRHPAHEPLHARLIALQAATGQRAAALGTYQRIQRRLADEFGIGPGALLVSAYQEVLAAGR